MIMVNDGCSICLELNLKHLLQLSASCNVFCDFSFWGRIASESIGFRDINVVSVLIES